MAKRKNFRGRFVYCICGRQECECVLRSQKQQMAYEHFRYRFGGYIAYFALYYNQNHKTEKRQNKNRKKADF